MKQQILLILSLCTIPVIGMNAPNNNVARPLNFDESEDISYDGELEDFRSNFEATKVLCNTFNYGNTLSNEEASKGLPKPSKDIFGKNIMMPTPKQSTINGLSALKFSFKAEESIKKCPSTPKTKRINNNQNNTNVDCPKTPLKKRRN